MNRATLQNWGHTAATVVGALAFLQCLIVAVLKSAGAASSVPMQWVVPVGIAGGVLATISHFIDSLNNALRAGKPVDASAAPGAPPAPLDLGPIAGQLNAAAGALQTALAALGGGNAPAVAAAPAVPVVTAGPVTGGAG